MSRSIGAAALLFIMTAMLQLLPWFPVAVTSRTWGLLAAPPLLAWVIACWYLCTIAMRRFDVITLMIAAALGLLLGGLTTSEPGVADSGKLVLALLAGTAFAAWFDRVWWVAAALATIGLADAWSVWSSDGFTHQLQSSGGSAARLLVIALPGIGTTAVSNPVGMLDLAFLAWILAVADRWRLGAGRVSVALLVATLAVLAVGVVERQFIPMLPFAGVALIVALHPWSAAELRRARAERVGWRSDRATR
jgi:hypothetical protein